jgi:hypothetical protein
VVLLAVVLLIVGVFRVFGDAPQSPVQGGPRYTELPTLVTHEPDDGVATPPPVQSPSVAPGAANPVDVAASFALGAGHSISDFLARGAATALH